MKYETIYTDFKNLFPEEKEYFLRMKRIPLSEMMATSYRICHSEYLSCLSSTDFWKTKMMQG